MSIIHLCVIGLFAGFDKDSAQQFFVEDGSHMKHSYDLNRLCLPPESADICLIKHTGQPYLGIMIIHSDQFCTMPCFMLIYYWN